MSEKRCINKCIYDKELQRCGSCHRTLHEIKQAGKVIPITIKKDALNKKLYEAILKGVDHIK